MNFHSFIVGGGIAGTVLALRFRERGVPVLLIDASEKNSCSNVAAGLMNPITGKRQTLSWRANEFFPEASSFYQKCENQWSEKFYHPYPIYRMLSSETEVNNWTLQLGEDRFKPFLHEGCIGMMDSDKFKNDFPSLRISGGGKLDIPEFLNTSHLTLLSEGRFIKVNKKVTFKSGDTYTFGGHTAQNLIYAEGWQHSRCWDFLPFTPMKGEILTISAELPEDRIVNGGCFIAPNGMGHFRVGATYEWRDINLKPTTSAKEIIEKRLKKMINVPHSVIAHQAGVRPAVKDRRPLLGRHPENSNVYLFNGLGSKGASMAPLLASWFIDNLDGSKLPHEVDLNRFT